MRANLIVLTLWVVISALLAPTMHVEQDRPPLPTSSAVPFSAPANVSRSAALPHPGVQPWNVNGVAVGMTRKQVEKLFGPRDTVHPEKNLFYEHFGMCPGYLGFANGTDVHFDDANIVSSVIGYNLLYNQKPIVQESWEEHNPDRRRQNLLKPLGRPDAVKRVGEYEHWFYSNPQLEVAVSPEYPWRFTLGSRRDP